MAFAVPIALCDFWFDRSVHFLALEQTPVKISEELHIFYLVVVFDFSFLRVFLQQSGDQFLARGIGEVFGEFEVVFLDLFVDADRII